MKKISLKMARQIALEILYEAEQRRIDYMNENAYDDDFCEEEYEIAVITAFNPELTKEDFYK